MTPILWFAILICWSLAATPAWSVESAPQRSPRATATLISETDTFAPGTPFRVALRLRLAQGWHIYWRNPGDSGAAPELTPNLPPGFTASAIDWAAPQPLPEGPLMTYGYVGEVLFPITIAPVEVTATSARIEIQATWLVCKDICVPEDGRFVLTLTRGPPRASPESALFITHDASTPRRAPFAATIAPSGQLRVVGEGLTQATVRQARFIPVEPDRIRNETPQTLTVGDNGFTLALMPVRQDALAGGIAGVLSLRDAEGQAVALWLRAEPGGDTNPETPFWQALVFAFWGGAILNLMPCVFPVLAIKAMAILGGATPSRGRAMALAYTAGVLATFTVLALALLTLRASGAAIGWGFQFQSPLYVALMGGVLFAVGLNLSGVFHVGGRMAGAGTALASRGGLAGDFCVGALAVLVATPCTAPFMGVAIAAGLAAPPMVALAVFLALGLGFAAPNLVLGFCPRLARWLPRPGAWMETLRQALAFPMYGAVVWLLWVISQSAGPDGVLALGVSLTAIALAAWLLRLWQSRDGGRFPAILASLASLAALTALIPLWGDPSPPSRDQADRFSESILASARASGRPVFVNVTAAWCVSCLVNEQVVLRAASVETAFTRQGVIMLKADWTRRDGTITAYLRQFDRDGVPLYVLYPAGHGAPVVLPQILTPGLILAELERR
jgi:thiol:disulfide interchange protein DsbD